MDTIAMETLLSQLQADGYDDLANELEVLQSIFGTEAIGLWNPSSERICPGQEDCSKTLRFEMTLDLPNVEKESSILVLVSLDPSTYPASTPPQLQLLSRYIGPYGVDAPLFGSVLRTYMSQEGVEFTPGSVCLFDGLQNVLEYCSNWCNNRLEIDTVGEIIRDEERNKHMDRIETETPAASEMNQQSQYHISTLPERIIMHEAEAILDRKSSFVGRACTITHHSQVPLIVEHLSSDRRIARAAHPVIRAWRCQIDGIQHQDNDDDGETAAGGRLAHLLQILDVNNVLVIVTRYFGGIHLGPDRFKHINQAARNALELGGYLESTTVRKVAARR